MPSRHFKISAISKLRQIERDRALERLQELGERHPVESGSSTDESERDVAHAETQEISSPSHPTPLSDRLRTIPPESVPKRPGGAQRAVMLDSGGHEVSELPCDETAGILIIGRGHNATVRVSDPYVHRVHAHIRWDSEANAHIIAHGGGDNSTYVDERKLRTPSRLSNGTRIRVGRTELVYRIE